MSCNKCYKKNCNCDKGCSSVVVDGNYVYQAWATDENGSDFSLIPFQSDGTKFPYTAVIISPKKIDLLQPINFEGRWFPTSYNPNGIQIGDDVSLLNNDVPYLKNGDNISELNNDENYLKNGDNISTLNNDEGYIKDSQGITDALGYVPEDEANKNQPNGYPTLDANGLVPVNQLPQINLSGQIFVYENEVEMNASINNINGNLAVLENPTGTSKSYLWFEGVWIPVASYNVSSINGLTGDVTGVLFDVDLKAKNGLNKDADGYIVLGGVLSKVTQISTDGNVFTIKTQGDAGVESKLEFEEDNILIEAIDSNSNRETYVAISPYNLALEAKDRSTNARSNLGLGVLSAILQYTKGFGASYLNQVIRLDENGIKITDQNNLNANGIGKGLFGAFDYSVNYTDLSYVQKAYVDSILAGIENVLADNGLTKNGNIIELGGQLNRDTNINANGNDYSIGNASSIVITNSPQSSPFVVSKQHITINDSGITIKPTLGRRDGFINLLSAPDSRGRTFILFDTESAVNQRGFHYISDFSLLWDASTESGILTTKGYVDRQIANNSSGASNGLNKSGNDIKLGGTLTEDTNIDGNNNSLTLSNNSFLLLDSNDNLLIRANNSGNGGSIELIAENSDISAEASNINLFAELARLGGNVSIELDSIGNTARLGNYGNTLVYFISDKHLFVDSLNASQNKGIYYPTDYTINWDGTTPDEIIPTKGYVDRKVIQAMTFARNGNVGNGAYLRGSGNIAHNNSFGELVATDVVLNSLTYRVNSANDTSGDFLLVLRIYDSLGGLLRDIPLLAPSSYAEVNTIELNDLNLGFDGVVEQGQMIAVQFRRNGASVTTTLNRVQATLKLTNI